MRLLCYFLFCLFFAVGAGGIALSLEADRVLNYYKSKGLVEKTGVTNRKLELLNADYDARLEYVRSDPNVLRRLEQVALGRTPTAPDTAFPKASEEQLASAKKVLFEAIRSEQNTTPAIPEWARRCSQPAFRNSLFFAGAALILIAFMFFGSSPATKLM